jgi:ubiquinone/menaquinone biosynthesis C-methylase UbiE
MDIQNVPFPDNSFDIVIANHLLYHVSDIEKALSEVKRILTTDGVFYATTVGKDHLMQLEAIYKIYNNFCKFSYSSDLSFLLENGYSILKNYFSSIDKKLYKDSLEVTDIKDLMDYIVSYNKISNEIYQEIFGIIKKEIEREGMMKIVKNSGMFICKK